MTDQIKWVTVKPRRRWPEAEWVAGRGPYAVLAWCGALTVTRWETSEAAERAKDLIDRTGCGSRCNGVDHEIETVLS